MSDAAAPLFLLSFRQRDELAQLASGAGWHVVAARRADGIARRLLASGARVAVVDARGALDEGLAAIVAISGIVAANGGALLALVSRGDVGAIGRVYDAGATHFLASPAGEGEFVQTLRFAARHAERVAGDWNVMRPATTLGWRIGRDAGAVLTDDLASALDLPERLGARALFRRVAIADRPAVVAAIRRMRATGTSAVAHGVPGAGRFVEHLRQLADGGIEALVERLPSGEAEPEREWRTRERDAGDARRWITGRLATGRPLAAMQIALTRFDLVNAAHGRAAGDLLLRAVARRIRDVGTGLFGQAAFVARVAGSEFLLIVDADSERTALAAGQLEETLAQPFPVDGALAALGSRIGVAETRPGDDAAALLRRTSQALASAKASDGATLRMTLRSGPAPIDALAVDLHHAMDRDEIDIVFQPQVEIASNRITGVEALARWDHARLGHLGADTLFAAAERADLGVALSDHIQGLVLARAAAWPASLAHIRLSLNVTAADVARAGFASMFLARVDASGFPRERLTIEITESGLIADLDAAASLLGKLRAAGCRIAIDDFGTGYSSLAYLKALPLDYLKIDKALAQDITGSARDRVVVRGVIDMARSLGLAVIAEGVETQAQLGLLSAQGCDFYQGYLCAEPLGDAALARLVEDKERCDA
ncbi:diguanylate cyclase [Sphingomonas sp. Leaf17]|uniref:putative bifunctional diguanylate cyclase/phosphodiesterase n=1 Tax=Sphingomonas sp. Leaf17 TaxID=1735683 RepID=UPI0006F682F2|nr:bifunctional diguanylate cyclase/phosphodiesterase [Sphingomonas sp. Leaf17]KQM64837.1 diguanylate cyclase [Sphingomonas sp. Leaf17]